MYHIFWRLRRIPIGAQSNNNDIFCRSRRACAFIWFTFFLFCSLYRREQVPSDQLHTPSTLATLFSLPSLFLCVCVCSPCVYCCSNGRSWEERSPPWWCYRPLYLESSAVGRVSAMGEREREMLLPSFSSTQQQPTHTHAQLGASKCFRLHQGYGWWDGWTDGRELERRKE